VTDLIYFSIEPRPDGSLDTSHIGPDDPATLASIKSSTGVRLLLTVGGGGRSQHFPAMAGDVAARRRFVANLLAYCREHGFDGVDYDWEHPTDQQENSDYAALLIESAAAFDTHALIVTLAQAAWQNVGPDTYAAVDRVHLMSYDHRFPHATFDAAERDIQRMVDHGCPAAKIALGVPFYGRNEQGDARRYGDLIEQTPFDPDRDQIDGYAFNGQATIARKLDLIRQRELAGVMIWELGQDSTDATTSLLAVIGALVDDR
jgi:GH18 family chitinase